MCQLIKMQLPARTGSKSALTANTADTDVTQLVSAVVNARDGLAHLFMVIINHRLSDFCTLYLFEKHET